MCAIPIWSIWISLFCSVTIVATGFSGREENDEEVLCYNSWHERYVKEYNNFRGSDDSELNVCGPVINPKAKHNNFLQTNGSKNCGTEPRQGKNISETIPL